VGWFDWLRRKPAETPEDVERLVRDIIDRLDAQDYQGIIEWYPALGIAGHMFYDFKVPDDAAARVRLQQHCLVRIREYLDDTTDRAELDELLRDIASAKLPVSLELYRNRIAYGEQTQVARVRTDVARSIHARDIETLIRGWLELDDVWDDLDLDVTPREALRAEIGRALAGFLPSPFARSYERMRDRMDDISGDPEIEPVFHTLAEVRPGGTRTIDLEPIDAELDRALAAATTDTEHREASLVLADWLQERDHPRGTLIALQLAGKPTHEFIVQHAEELLGPLARYKVFGALSWRRGFVERAIVTSLDPQCLEILEHVLAQRGLAELAIGINADAGALIDRMIAMIVGARPKLRALHFTDLPEEDHAMPQHENDFNRLWEAVPTLRTLVVNNYTPTLDGLALPELERALFKIEVLQTETIEALAAARLPKLHTLDLWFGESDLDDYRTILGGRAPSLTHLGMIKMPATDHVCPLLEPFASTLIELDLTDSSLTDDGAARLAAMRLPKLACLEITGNHVTATGLERLRSVYPNVVA